MRTSFQMKYPITNVYITNKLNRPRLTRKHTLFGVAHDTGNINSTARNNVNYMNRVFEVKNGNNVERGSDIPFRVASAHIFVDDKEILVGVPLDEKAWHVIYDVKTDNQMFGDDANDAAIGVELCYFSDMKRSMEAYKRYVWVWAFLANRYKFTDIRKQITFHSTIDPGRKTDPKTALSRLNISYDKFLDDVIKEYRVCKNQFGPK
jgi:N-acetylmuramoyl-L-alanine amidase